MEPMTPFERALHEVNWDFSAQPPALRCPITGQIVLAGYDPVTGDIADGVEQPHWEKVPTVLFHFIDEIGEFDFIRDDLRAAIEKKRMDLGADADDMHDFEILSEHLTSLGHAPIIFKLTTHGIACGPVSSSVYVGLDLAALAAGEDNE